MSTVHFQARPRRNRTAATATTIRDGTVGNADATCAAWKRRSIWRCCAMSATSPSTPSVSPHLLTSCPKRTTGEFLICTQGVTWLAPPPKATDSPSLLRFDERCFYPVHVVLCHFFTGIAPCASTTRGRLWTPGNSWRKARRKQRWSLLRQNASVIGER